MQGPTASGNEKKKSMLPYTIAGVISIFVIILSMVSFISFAKSTFTPPSISQTADPSIIFSVDDFFKLINAGKYTEATERYAYSTKQYRTAVDPRMAVIFPRGSIDRAEVYDFRATKTRCTAKLKVYMKDGKVKFYKEDLTLYRDQSRDWKIDCANIDDAAYWE